MNAAEVVDALAGLSDDSPPLNPEESAVFEALARKLASAVAERATWLAAVAALRAGAPPESA